MWVIGGAVAEIDSIGYATLEDAIAAVKNNETIVVLADCETADAKNGKTFTIAMNGHTLTGITWVTDDTTLTLDGSVEGSAYNGSVYVGYSDNNNGNVTLNGGTYTCASGNTVLHINGTCLNSNVTIRNANVTSPDDNGIQLNGSGTCVIENSVITGATGVYVKSGNLTITGSTITGNMSPANYSYNGNGANATGDAIIVDSCEYPGGAPVVYIGAGNTFNGTKNQVGYYEYDANNDGTTVPAVVRSVTNDLTLSAGYAWAKDGEDYIVAEAVAQVGTALYASLADAIAAAQSGETVVLLKDVEIESITVDKAVTLDLDGFEVSSDAPNLFTISAGGNLAASASTNWRHRSYAAVDGVDAVSCRPDFTILVYPAWLVPGSRTESTLPVVLCGEYPVDAQTPPAFLLQAHDDHAHVENALAYYVALKYAGVAADLHVFDTGGHGFGLRKLGTAVDGWEELAAKWLVRTVFADKAK